MSDPYLNCAHCGDQCACRATRDELNKYKDVLRDLLKNAERILGDEDGECKVVDFMLSLRRKVEAAGISMENET